MKRWIGSAVAVSLTALLAGCGGPGTDYNEAAASGLDVNAIADQHLLSADARAREEAVANGVMPEHASATYECAGDTRFEARFDNIAGTATLTDLGGAEIVLTQQRAGSGIWYQNDRVALRGKGREATLSRDGEPDIACTARE